MLSSSPSARIAKFLSEDVKLRTGMRLAAQGEIHSVAQENNND